MVVENPLAGLPGLVNENCKAVLAIETPFLATTPGHPAKCVNVKSGASTVFYEQFAKKYARLPFGDGSPQDSIA
jgi:hypothetical protein